MHSFPNMIMIGGNSRNSGKTTLACSIISKFSVDHEVIGLKVTRILPGESKLHGKHTESLETGYTLFEEFDTGTAKDTSRMLKAGATRVFYIRAEDNFIEKGVLHLLSRYINNQVIVCESRSLRTVLKPGLFLMMMKLNAETAMKDVSAYLPQADKIIYNGENQEVINNFVAGIKLVQGEFKVAQ